MLRLYFGLAAALWRLFHQLELRGQICCTRKRQDDSCRFLFAPPKSRLLATRSAIPMYVTPVRTAISPVVMDVAAVGTKITPITPQITFVTANISAVSGCIPAVAIAKVVAEVAAV